MSKDEALKLALEFVNDIRRGKYKGDAEEISTAIKQALAHPVQEPVAWMRYEEDCAGDPVLVLSRSTEEGAFRVYKEPAQRPWVKLTDEQVRQLCGSVPSMKAAVREAEAELKEKNT